MIETNDSGGIRLCEYPTSNQSAADLFLVLQQFINLGFEHALDIFKVQPELLCLFSFFAIHLQDGVVPLLQILETEMTSAARSASPISMLRLLSRPHLELNPHRGDLRKLLLHVFV